MMTIDEIIQLIEQESTSIRTHGSRKAGSDTFRCSLIFTRDSVKYVLFIAADPDNILFQYGFGIDENSNIGTEYTNMGTKTETALPAETAMEYADSEIENLDWEGPACQLYMDTPSEGFCMGQPVHIEPDWTHDRTGTITDK